LQHALRRCLELKLKLQLHPPALESPPSSQRPAGRTSTMDPSSMTMASPAIEIAMDASGSSSWLGLFGRLILAVLHLVSAILYWAIRITITIPSLLFKGFSTTWTVTMNATTM